MFLVSVRVPNSSWPMGRSDRLESTRMEPWSMRASETPSALTRSRSADTYARATSGARSPAPMMGLVTISISGTPARLQSTSDRVAPWMRPEVPPRCVSLPVSSSMCARSISMRHSVPSSRTTSRWPLNAIGSSYWEIW